MKTFKLPFGIELTANDTLTKTIIRADSSHTRIESEWTKPRRWPDIVTEAITQQAGRIINYAGFVQEGIVAVVYMSEYTQTPWVHVIKMTDQGKIISALWHNTNVYQEHPDFQNLIEQLLIDIVANPTCYRMESPAVISACTPIMFYSSPMLKMGEEVIVS